ncbi:MAG: PAS domain S-box protein, partial [Syntrophorhabdales bacterium]
DQLFEWKARRPGDGSTFDVEVCLSKLSLPQGDFVLASCRDITQRKGIEKLLIKEREVFFSVMNDNPHGIALFDNSGSFVYFNPEFTAITGYTLEDVPTGREWVRKAYPDPEYRAKVLEFWRSDRLPEGRGKDVEWRIACKNGQNKDVEFRVTYLGDKSLVVLTDTTARNRAEEEVRAEKQKFQVLSESSPVGMLMAGADDRVKYVNPKFIELFGYDLIDIPDLKNWFMRVYPEPSYRRRALSQRLHDLNSVRPGEGRPYVRKVTCRDGTLKYINFIPVTLETGEILITCEDITKSKEAEDKIRERNLELEVLNDIIASVSSSLHLPEILETLKKVFVGKLKIPVGGIFFYEELGNRLNGEICWGIPDAMKTDFETFAASRYSSETIVCENEVTLAKRHPHFRPSNDLLVHRFLNNWHRYLCAPLSAKGEIQGMILLIDKAPGILRDDQIPFFRTMVQQIGVAIQNARLFSQVRQSHTEMKALSLRLVRVQEAELRHVARELHDEIGQLLTVLRLALEMALQSPGDQTARVLEAKSHANTLTGLVRQLSRNLRPSMLDDLGLLPTLPWLFERFSTQTNVRVVFEHSRIDNKRFPQETETAVYRVAQEALTNAARHAKVDSVTVRLWSNDKILGIQIEDRGVGFDFQATLKTGDSSGLNGMRERVMLLGGRFTVETSPGSGTRLTAELPTDTESIQ